MSLEVTLKVTAMLEKAICSRKLHLLKEEMVGGLSFNTGCIGLPLSPPPTSAVLVALTGLHETP